MTSMITKAKTTLFEIMITNKQINKQTNKYIVKTNVIFIVMTTMITSAKTTLFEIMITKNRQTNQQTNKQTNNIKQQQISKHKKQCHLNVCLYCFLRLHILVCPIFSLQVQADWGRSPKLSPF